jgi:hypothetical protein
MVRPTGFRAQAEPEPTPRLEFQRIYDSLWRDEKRNAMICADVLSAIREGRSPLVLTERTDHLEVLTKKLSDEGTNVIALRGGMGRRKLREALERVSGAVGQDHVAYATQSCLEAPRVILATGRFIGEGFDDPRLDTLFLKCIGVSSYY